jgi:hypothetical protein
MGHQWENSRGMILRAKRKKKKPTWIKKAAKKRYRDRLLSLMAKTAQPAPRMIKKKAPMVDKGEPPLVVPKRKALPRSIDKRPIINIKRAIIRRLTSEYISLSISALSFPCQWERAMLGSACEKK